MIPIGTAGNGANLFAKALGNRLGLDPHCTMPAQEDAWYYLWRERKLPVNVDPLRSKLEDKHELSDFKQTGTRELKAAETLRQVHAGNGGATML